VARLLKPGMMVVDLGANAGYYSLLASGLVGSSGHVYAFEPDPENFDYLSRNLEINGCGNVTALRKAAADHVGTQSFLRSDPERGFLSAGTQGGDSITVETTSLDAFFASAGWPSVHVVKMDIEGSESAALEGMAMLSRQNPHLQLIMEFNLTTMQRVGADPSKLCKTLMKLGFSTGKVVEQDLKAFSLAEGLPISHSVFNILVTK
jgi:FkbM family methyltransferase